MSENVLEIRPFGIINTLFRERNWSYPYYLTVKAPITGFQLLDLLDLSSGQVEALFINGKAERLSAVVQTGDRIGLIPHGTPGVIRLMTGIRG